MKNINVLISSVIAIILLSSCASIPKGVQPISNFQKEKYLGKWYEIARLDYRFERNLNNATANYTIKENGNIRVENQGFNYKKNEWKKAIGNAKFRGSDKVGALKVSFFGPFYAGYNVVDIDENYQNALVYGSSNKYIWILSRNKTIDEKIKQRFLQKAKNDGFDIDALIWVEHNK